MKKLIIGFVGYLSILCNVYGQNSIWVVTQLKDTTISSVPLPDFNLKLFVKGNSLVNLTNDIILPVRNDDVDFPIGVSDEKLVITFYDYDTSKNTIGKKVKLKDAGVKSISIIVDNVLLLNKEIMDYEKNYENYHVGLSQLKNLKSGSIIQVLINKSDDITYFDGNSAYFKYFSPTTFYGPLKNAIPGLWFPTGMFATNFNRTDNGIIFAPMPIGVAWGMKFNTKKGNYWGTSLCANWLIYQQKTDNNINFNSIAPGILLDINNLITVGVVYGIDLTSKKINPGFSLVVGIAPDLLNLIKK